MPASSFDALEAQTTALVELVSDFQNADWTKPTRCVPWTVLELAAHLIAVFDSTTTLAEMDASGREPNTDRARWWVMPDRRPPTELLTHAQEAADELDPGAVPGLMAQGAAGMISVLRRLGPDAVVGNEWRTLRAEELAGSRVLECGVHSMDLGHATGRGEQIVPPAAEIVADILDTLLDARLPANLGWDRRTYILTGTGRRALSSNERHVLGPLADRFPLVQ